MSSWRKAVPHGAAALAAVLCAGARADASVTVVNLSWQFYQGGLAQQDPESFVLEQDTFDNLAQNEVTRSLGGATFSSVASITNSTLLETDSVVMTSVATLSASAATPAPLPDGRAEAFAGLSIFDITFEIADAPHIYLGSRPLEGEAGTFSDGAVLEPGFYGFVYFHPFSLDASVVAMPGEDLSDEELLTFHFEFRPVPGPAPAALLPVALALAGRRRRRTPAPAAGA